MSAADGAGGFEHLDDFWGCMGGRRLRARFYTGNRIMPHLEDGLTVGAATWILHADSEVSHLGGLPGSLLA